MQSSSKDPCKLHDGHFALCDPLWALLSWFFWPVFSWCPQPFGFHNTSSPTSTWFSKLCLKFGCGSLSVSAPISCQRKPLWWWCGQTILYEYRRLSFIIKNHFSDIFFSHVCFYSRSPVPDHPGGLGHGFLLMVQDSS